MGGCMCRNAVYQEQDQGDGSIQACSMRAHNLCISSAYAGQQSQTHWTYTHTGHTGHTHDTGHTQNAHTHRTHALTHACTV